MGQDIAQTRFSAADHAAFRARLEAETDALRAAFAAGALSWAAPRIGCELEAWLVDRALAPAPHNPAFLARIGDPQVVAELSRFNIELNGDPQPLAGDGLARLEADLTRRWARCVENAHADIDTLLAIGTLPTLTDADLSLAAMTPSNRYRALNRALFARRGGAPVTIDIAGPGGAHLHSVHHDVMLEAAATSFQLHLQAPPDRIGALHDAAVMLSGPLVALSANSPFLFGKALWHETRIAAFEQAFEPLPRAGDRQPRRVTFGSGYVGVDPVAPFVENLRDYPVLLPVPLDEPPARYPALRLHNGTIWRWNRLLVGCDEGGDRAAPTPHLRLEQRVMPAGPSFPDMIANAAFFLGAVHALADAPPVLPFAVARANFRACAQRGLLARIHWDGTERPVREVLADLAARARAGLLAQQVAPDLVDRTMTVIDLRLASGRNGAAWQLAHHARHGDLRRLTADYLENQRSGAPVHEWPV
ncbi:MAG: hypothetical protein KGM17_04680 [Sphingomonadales bacterium]|nr:hypothetical protein [Sphingomonadales bacterium]